MGPMDHASGIDPSQQPPGMPSPWDFPINITGDPNDPNTEALDLMTANLAGFDNAQWAQFLGSDGWNP